MRPNDEVLRIPFADGGEGTLLAIQAARSDVLRNYCPEVSPDAYWLLLDGSTAIDAATGIDEFNKQFNASIPEASDYGTIAGFLQKLSGKLPEVNEEIKFGDFQFTILSKSARRIRQVKITPLGKAHGGEVRT